MSVPMSMSVIVSPLPETDNTMVLSVSAFTNVLGGGWGEILWFSRHYAAAVSEDISL